MGASLHHWPRGTKFASEYMPFPFSRGFDYVLYNGRIYPGPIPITDPDEQNARLPAFGAKMGDLLENWPERYTELTDEWTAMLSYCLLYTSDAADDLLCVDLGGRRI